LASSRTSCAKLRGEGCKVTVVPAQTPAEDVLALKPDGVFLSNGPGDPEPCTYAVDNIRRLMGRQPIFGICLGHQLTGIALGGKTFKLKFGHHGGQPSGEAVAVRQSRDHRHNHNFAVDPDSLPQSEVELTHMDLNDNTLEGMRHRNLPLFTVQYHPEAAPGRMTRIICSRICEDDGGVQGIVASGQWPVVSEDMRTIVAIVVLLCASSAQVVTQPWNIPCKEEIAQPNLEVKIREHVFGQLKDRQGLRLKTPKLSYGRKMDKASLLAIAAC